MTWRILVGGVLLTTEEQRLLVQAYHALDLAEIAARPQGASAMQTQFPTELGTYAFHSGQWTEAVLTWARAAYGHDAAAEQLHARPIIGNDYLHAGTSMAEHGQKCLWVHH